MPTETIPPKTLNATEARLLTTLSGRGQNIFSVPDAQRVLRKPNATVRKILHALTQRHWLQRLTKGKYLIVPLSAGADSHYTENELIIAAHLITPYYLAYWTALSHYAMTEQPTRTVYIATPKRRQAFTLHGITYRFITLTRQKFFGYTRVWIGAQTVVMADRVKTLVDALDHPELCGGIIEAAKGLWRSRDEMDWKRLEAYAVRMGNGAILKRLGYLLDVFDIGPSHLRQRLHKRLSAGYAVLDPLSPHQGMYNTRWRLLINLNPDALTHWRET